jgi:hypothetical protein
MRSREEIRAERQRFAREHDGRQRDLPAQRVGELCDNATMRVAVIAEAAIANASIRDDSLYFALPTDPDNPVFEQLVRLYVMSTPGFREWLTQRAEGIASAFSSKLTTEQYAERMADFDGELQEIEAEGQRIEIEAAKKALEEELAALEKD